MEELPSLEYLIWDSFNQHLSVFASDSVDFNGADLRSKISIFVSLVKGEKWEIEYNDKYLTIDTKRKEFNTCLLSSVQGNWNKKFGEISLNLKRIRIVGSFLSSFRNTILAIMERWRRLSISIFSHFLNSWKHKNTEPFDKMRFFFVK